MARDFHRVTSERAAGQPGGGSADRNCGAAGISDAGMRAHFPGSGKTSGDAADLGDAAARARRAMVRTISTMELPDSGTTRVVDLGFSLSAGVFLAVTARRPGIWGGWVSRCTAAMLALSAVTMAIFPFAPRWSAGKLELTVLDVGQGDSLFVVSPHGRTLLIDGGGAFGGFPGREEHNGIDPGEEAVSPYLWSRGFQKLDVVALTHAHQDHIGGLPAIFENFQVGTLWIGREAESAALANLENLAREKKIRVVREIRGNAFSWDGVETQLLWPEIAPTEVGPAPKNNDSLVMRLKYGKRSIMLTGDAEKQAESSMLADNSEEALRADVLKVGHHGSKNSTMPGFLAAVRPRVAVISAGEDNIYGHPNPEFLERLTNAGVRILRTDKDGAVHVLTDGKQVEISCFVACPEKTTRRWISAGAATRSTSAPRAIARSRWPPGIRDSSCTAQMKMRRRPQTKISRNSGGEKTTGRRGRIRRKQRRDAGEVRLLRGA